MFKWNKSNRAGNWEGACLIGGRNRQVLIQTSTSTSSKKLKLVTSTGYCSKKLGKRAICGNVFLSNIPLTTILIYAFTIAVYPAIPRADKPNFCYRLKRTSPEKKRKETREHSR